MAKILLNCLDVVGEAMAGPAVRYWEFAKELSKNHEVILKTPNIPDIRPDGFTFLQGDEIPPHTDIIITQEISHTLAIQARRRKIKIILDAYDPQPLEYLEIFKESDMVIRNHRQNLIVNTINFSFQMADAVICASQKQKDLWMGVLMAMKRLTPLHYDQDSSLRHFMGLVPFGLNEKPPQRCGPGLREKFNLADSDKVLLWGGGIWNWFDPLTLIEALRELCKTRSDIKLIFMGVKHPNMAVPEMNMAAEALSLAKKYHLLERNVFFNFGWVPYEQRQNYLLEADIGISTHFEHLETQYAFRTRMLDYIWAGLPIVATQGDAFADLIQKETLGITVPPCDSQALAEAIEAIVDNPALAKQMRENQARIRPRYHWNEVVKPINEMVDHLLQKKKNKFSLANLRSIATYYMTNKSPFALVKKAILRLALTTRT